MERDWVYGMCRIRSRQTAPRHQMVRDAVLGPGGCSSDRTIVRLNVDIGVGWCFPWF
jgi:hypothetical protein